MRRKGVHIKRRFAVQMGGSELFVNEALGTVSFLTREDSKPGEEWRVCIDQRLLNQLYPRLARSAKDLWPEATEERAAFNLMGVHLQEALLTSRNSRHVELSATGITFVALANETEKTTPRGTPSPL
ncbi:hypothetical protein [Herbiconiux sp. VKM Ac-2851]|uniref:hypothetical protein n=1 Tax=Herbiconiux sp. VKM Ac-2851 TaxID=2739025 RepID=UPI001562F64C|nr:hypothetical protein [Herbiconiux sp. VKM Ac-2851]NQX34077.1 hypothetical protein [Herbiconiux sp. VKM Ac-2851]